MNKVSMDLRKGEVHALIGENGAGKSTLMKILTGVYEADEGRMIYKGEEITIASPHDAQQKGISIIYQELNLIPHLTVAQNIFLGREPMIYNWVLDEKKLNEEAAKILAALHQHIDPSVFVKDLTVSKMQMVEIARAVSFESDILIMDEPTSALTEAEIDELFKIIHHLRDKGVGIIYISHRLEELQHIVDRITVLRDGTYVGTYNYTDIALPELISKMVGRTLDKKYPERKVKREEKILEVKNIKRQGVLNDISFDLYKGEVLGLSGLMGAGRTELARAIFGADHIDEGTVILEGKTLSIKNPRDAIKAGIGYISEDRKEDGLVLNLQVDENITLANVDGISNALGILSGREENKIADKYIAALQIKTPSSKQIIKNLSGGNQQKVVLAKWLYRHSKVLIFDEPTRGIDVGAKFEVYELINDLVKNGVGIIMISSELPEILGMSDRIIVLHEGEITGELDIKDATQEKILNLATGITDENSGRNR